MSVGRRSRGASQPASHLLSAAVIGAGTMGRHHARVLADLDSVRFVGVADPDEAVGAGLGRRHKVPYFGDFRALLDELQPDLVSVAVPTGVHALVGLDVLARGIHLLMEKPIAATPEDGAELIRAAQAQNVKFAVGHLERFNPAIVQLKQRLEAEELGRIFKIHARRLGPFPGRIRDVGIVIDLATHDLDIMRFIHPVPVTRVYAETARSIHTDHEDLLLGTLRFSDGTAGLLDVNWLTPTKIRELTVTGERGMFLVDYLTQDLYFYANDTLGEGWDALSHISGVSEGNMTKFRISKQEPLRLELEDFVQAVAEDRPVSISGQEALETLELAHDLVRSADRGEVIRYGR